MKIQQIQLMGNYNDLISAACMDVIIWIEWNSEL